MQRAVVADTGAPTLVNHVRHDKDQIGGKFCLAISGIRKSWSFNHLTLANIIQGVMEEGPTISARLSGLTFKPSAFTFLSSMTIRRAAASTISNSKKWKIRASFTSELNPRHKYTANKVLRSRISVVLVDPEFRTSSSERAACRKLFRSSVSFHSVGIGQSRLR